MQLVSLKVAGHRMLVLRVAGHRMLVLQVAGHRMLVAGHRMLVLRIAGHKMLVAATAAVVPHLRLRVGAMLLLPLGERLPLGFLLLAWPHGGSMAAWRFLLYDRMAVLLSLWLPCEAAVVNSVRMVVQSPTALQLCATKGCVLSLNCLNSGLHVPQRN